MDAPNTPNAEAGAQTREDDHARGGGLARTARLVGGMTLLSRLFGLVRDVVVIRTLGDGALGSAFRAASMIPNVFRRLFGEGALSAAFLPQYARLRGSERAGELARAIVWGGTLVTSVITLVIEVVLLLRLLLWEASPQALDSIRLIMLLLPMMPAVCLTAILGGVLQAHGKFGVPAAVPIVLNVMQIIAGLLMAWGVFGAGQAGLRVGVHVVGLAAVSASVMCVVWSAWSLRGVVSLRPVMGGLRNARGNEDVRVVWQRFVPAMLGLGTLQLSTMLDTAIAMWPTWVGPTMLGRATPLDEASNVILGSTQTLYQFPLGVFGIAVATAVFPLLSRAAGDGAEFVRVLRRGVRLSLFVGLPASVGLVVVREDLVRTIYGGWLREGGFSEDGLSRSAAVLLGYAPAVWAYSINHVLTRGFYALGDTRTPMRIAVGALVVNLVLNLLLVFWLREAGLAWATAIGAIVQCVALALLLRARVRSEGPHRLLDGETARALLRTVASGAIMGAMVLLVRLGLESSHGAIRLIACVATGGLAYVGTAWVFGASEIRWLLSRGGGKDDAAGMDLG